MKLVILAGGKGTRMGTITKTIPKPMIHLADKPILEHQIEFAKRYGIEEIIILSGYEGEVIENYFNDGKRWGVEILYHRENIPLGTSGAVKEIEDWLHDDFLVFYGDIVIDIDLDSFISFHLKRKPIATIVVHPNDHPYDSDLIEVDEHNRVITIHNKPHQDGVFFRNLVNAAVYIFSPNILKHIPNGIYSDFGKDIFPKLVASGESIYAYNTPEYIKDIGTLNRLKEVENDLTSGKVARLNKKNKRKAILIDRDGVLNFEVDLLRNADELELLPEAPDAIKKLNKSDYLSVVVTNQPVIAKGFTSEKELNEIHSKLETLLSFNHAYFDRIYYCPHHPEKGFKGERQKYKIDCNCRKPKTGMIEKAISELNIDEENSFLIGDSTIDIMTGINAGLKTILVRTGYAGDDGRIQCEADFCFENLRESVDFIVDTYDHLYGKADSLLSNLLFNSNNNPIIAVAGLSRSGKSTLSKIISIVLRGKGIPSKTLRLDNWLIGVNEREFWMTIRERYKYDRISNDLRTLLDGGKINVNRYDVKTRRMGEQSESFSLNKGEFLIVDGIVGLDIEYLRKIADLKIYIEIPEEIRKKRFYDFYIYKGLSEKDIKSLYFQRQNDESPIVVQTKRYADYIVDMNTLK